jgi:uncharacterized protein (TIGR02217 family)
MPGLTCSETLLNVEYSANASGGPEFSTAIVTCPTSGYRQRNISRADDVGRWAILYDLLTADALKALYAFFLAHRGMAYAFRFLAPEANAVPDSAPEQFGTGDGSTTVFNLYRKFTSGALNYSKRIVKPMAGGLSYVSGADTIKIYKAGVLQTLTTHYTISSTTGAVTFVSAPANGQALTWSGTFHLPATFGSDKFNSRIDVGGVSEWGIEIHEVLPAELGL